MKTSIKFLVTSVLLSSFSLLAQQTLLHKNLPKQQSLDNPSSKQKYDGSDIEGIEQIVAQVHLQEQGNSKHQWRNDAQARVNKYRKSQLAITIKDKHGNIIPNAKVQLTQLDHDFTFGGVIKAKELTHQASVLPHFISQIGFNNALKYKHKGGLAKHAQPVIDWAKQHNISVRGHCLIYPGWMFMHKDAKHLQHSNDLPALRAYFEDQISDYAAKWDVVEWDVMNETLDNFAIPNLLGSSVKAQWFKQAKQQVKNKDARLIINENRIISAPPEYIDRIESYKEEIKEVIADGGPIEVIGMQSRFRVDSITPEMVYQRLQRFNEFNLPIVATEFEIVNTPKYNFKPTHLRRAQMTEEYMQILFSHPNVDGIIAWTTLNALTSRSSMHAKTTNEKETKGILNWDMSLPLNGKVWLYLINKHWRTEVNTQTNSAGQLKINAFHGRYKVTLEHADNKTNHLIHIDKNTTAVTLTL